MKEEEIKIPEITPEMLIKVFNGESVQLLPPRIGYYYHVNKEGKIALKPVCDVVYTKGNISTDINKTLDRSDYTNNQT